MGALSYADRVGDVIGILLEGLCAYLETWWRMRGL
jgi:hypothetical protein